VIHLEVWQRPGGQETIVVLRRVLALRDLEAAHRWGFGQDHRYLRKGFLIDVEFDGTESWEWVGIVDREEKRA